MEFAKIRSGATSATMSNREFLFFVELVRGDACPVGFLPVEKIGPKPVPGAGEELCYTYTNLGDRITKGYFLAPKGTSFIPRKFSKLSVYAAIAKLGAWPQVQSWLESKTVDGLNGWMAFQLAQELSDAHPLFGPLAKEAKELLGLDDARFDAILGSCVLEG